MQQDVFQDFDKLVDTMQRSLEVLREAASQVNIKVLSGFEVDFFPLPCGGVNLKSS